MATELMMGSERAIALQASIQKELSVKGYSPEDDTVMAEYITIMLINDKTPDQVTNELAELVPDYDPTFTDWLFKEKSNPALESSFQEPAPAPPQPAAPPKDIPTVSDDRTAPAPGSRGATSSSRSQRPLHQQALSSLSTQQKSSPGGQKRQRTPSPTTNVPAKRRQPDLPDRPRAMRDESGPSGPRGGRTSLLDRVGPRNPNPNPPDHIQDHIRSITSTQPGNNTNIPQQPPMMGFPPGMDPAAMSMMQQQGFNPAMMGQPFPGSIEATMMAIQQFGQLALQMGLVPGAMGMGGGGPGQMQNGQQQGGFNGHARGGFQGDRNRRGGGPGGRPSQGGRGPPPNGPPAGDAAAPAPQPPAAPQPPTSAPSIVAPTPGPPGAAPAPASIPQRPISPTLCKFVTNCNNPTCRYSHPSPVATMESGVVLSTEPCEKGIHCDDKDCVKAHVSKAAKNAAVAPTVVAAAPVPAPSQPASVSQVPCRFDPHCTRPNCPYYHPSAKYKLKSAPCRFGAACTRADCTFTHPAGRVLPAQFSKGLNASAPSSIANKNGADSKNKTVDFRNKIHAAAAAAKKEEGNAPESNAPPATPTTETKTVDAVSGA